MLLRLGRGMTSNKCGAAAGGAGSPYLDGVLASVVFDLDATQEDSYSGSGTTWANLIASPADGVAQTDYDFNLGDGVTSTTYPTFTGTAGDSGAYFSFDGGDYFQSKVLTDLMRNAMRNDEAHPVTFVMAMNVPASFQYFWSCSGGGATNNYGFRTNNGTNLAYFGKSGGANDGNTIDSGAILSGSTDLIYIMSIDLVGNTGKHWVNTTAGTGFTPGMSGTTAQVDAGSSFFIGSYGGNSSLGNGAKIYSFAMLNEAIDDTKAADIIAHYEARHGRDYAV